LIIPLGTKSKKSTFIIHLGKYLRCHCTIQLAVPMLSLDGKLSTKVRVRRCQRMGCKFRKFSKLNKWRQLKLWAKNCRRTVAVSNSNLVKFSQR
ncbi:hypothetical protein T4B_15269, partial [Trichinella pseudospiralis]